LDLRNGLWIAVIVWQRLNITKGAFETLMNDFWLQYFKRPLDQLPRPHTVMSNPRNSFFDGEWYQCYDILEYIASNSPRNQNRSDFIANCNKAFQEELGGYRFIDSEIIQVTSEAEIESIEESLSATERLKPVHEPLRVALSIYGYTATRVVLGTQCLIVRPLRLKMRSSCSFRAQPS